MPSHSEGILLYSRALSTHINRYIHHSNGYGSTYGLGLAGFGYNQTPVSSGGISSSSSPWDYALAQGPPGEGENGGGTASTLAGGWVIALGEPTAVGEIVMGVATTGAILYYGPAIVGKMRAEIDQISLKAPNRFGIQYSLQATKAGTYPCYTCPNGSMSLNPGDVWKYGETTNPNNRYSQQYLNSMGLRFVPEFHGNIVEIKIAEKGKIYGYFFLNGHLPPGNKIFR